MSSEGQAALSYCRAVKGIETELRGNFEDFLEHLQVDQRAASSRAQHHDSEKERHEVLW